MPKIKQDDWGIYLKRSDNSVWRPVRQTRYQVGEDVQTNETVTHRLFVGPRDIPNRELWIFSGRCQTKEQWEALKQEHLNDRAFMMYDPNSISHIRK